MCFCSIHKTSYPANLICLLSTRGIFQKVYQIFLTHSSSYPDPELYPPPKFLLLSVTTWPSMSEILNLVLMILSASLLHWSNWIFFLVWIYFVSISLFPTLVPLCELTEFLVYLFQRHCFLESYQPAQGFSMLWMLPSKIQMLKLNGQCDDIKNWDV